MLSEPNFKFSEKIVRGGGFTLVELLIVLAIVAVLALASILALNPPELLRQSRDSRRISDISVMKTGLGVYIADVAVPNLQGGAIIPTCYGSWGPTSTRSCWAASGGPFAIVDAQAYVAGSSSTNINSVEGDGWLPVNFKSISSGAPFSNLPLDPINNTVNYYLYLATSSPGITFKLAVKTESVKYSSSGPNDVESTDGGRTPLWFESGTEISL